MSEELRHTDCDCCERAQKIVDDLRTQLAIKDKALRETVTMLKLLTHGRDRQALISEGQKALIIEVLDCAAQALSPNTTEAQ